MIIEIAVPAPGESISNVELARWLVEDGEMVEKDQEIAEVESDKATLPLIAEKTGMLKILIAAGTTVTVGTVVCSIDTAVSQASSKRAGVNEKLGRENKGEIQTTQVSNSAVTESERIVNKPDDLQRNGANSASVKITPLARNMMNVNALTVEDILKGIRKITTNEVHLVLDKNDPKINSTIKADQLGRVIGRETMSQLRKKLGKRLVSVKNETAMLTTFNEVDMSKLMDLRKEHQEMFTQKHGVKLGMVSFFTKAAAEVLQLMPGVNSMIDGDSILSPKFVDISIAVQTDKGLMVPVIRNVQTMNLAEIEIKIAELALKARSYRLSIEEMTGGTFSITNGGVFGSLLSTPILNPPQSAILGMHNIVERPVAISGKVEIRPMMYIALSYDHRIIDGRDSVSFLVKIKEMIQSPEQLFPEIIKGS
jgi:2-oxoglutarate dehydrogenase E2 component (dihydrolipoamide succinyltransferase)